MWRTALPGSPDPWEQARGGHDLEARLTGQREEVAGHELEIGDPCVIPARDRQERYLR
jgi:hypothetical protein